MSLLADDPSVALDAGETPVAAGIGAYANGVRAVQLNRAILALGFVGLFIAGTLSLAKFTNVVLPCGAGGASSSCQAVSEHPSAYWFQYPVAYYGLAGYLAITGLAALRELAGRELNRLLVGLGFLFSAGGFLASIYLQYTALFVIREKCAWCISSALVMLAIFIAHAWLFNLAVNAAVPGGGRTVPRAGMKALPFLVAGLLVASAGAFLVKKTPTNGPAVRDANISNDAELIPARRNQLGPDDAAVTIVEFADFNCPACRQTAMPTRELVKRYPGKVRLIFRHFPLVGTPGHEMAFPLAVVSELAADRGKFWPFHEAVMTSPEAPKTTDDVLAMARNIGLDPLDVGKIVDAGPSRQYEVVYRDFAEAQKLGVPGTPTFFVVVKGQKPKIVQSSALDQEFTTGEFAPYVK